MKPRLPALIAALSFPLVACLPATAQDVKPEVKGGQAQAQAAPGGAYTWEVRYEPSKVKLGIDPKDLKTFLDKQHGGIWEKSVLAREEEKKREAEKHGAKISKDVKGEWDRIWNVLLLWTPQQQKPVDLPAFNLSKYEVTNAQWEVFIKQRVGRFKTTGEETLEDLAMKFWSIDPKRGNAAVDIQRGWRSLLAMNESTLMPVLNEKKDAKWDILMARGQEKKLPAGLDLTYTRYIPPAHWTNGQLPMAERRRPMRAVSWEQAMDFCWWAGFHLPLEAEYERAARGETGRLFPWGDDWKPTNAIWSGYNAAAKVAYNAAIKAGNAKPDICPLVPPGGSPADAPAETPNPADVDTLLAGANPEGALHLVGNVGEMTLDFIRRWDDSAAEFPFSGLAVMTKGQHYQELRPELVNAVNRNWESQGGQPNRPDHVLEGMGFRLASYPVAGADLAAAAVPYWTDPFATPDRPLVWIPSPPGILDREKAKQYMGFDPSASGGLLKRTIKTDAAEKADFAFVQGPCRSLVFMPVKGFPAETVKTASDLNKYAADNERPIFLGLLLGSENVSIQVNQTGGVKTTVSMGDPRFWRAGEGRVLTQCPMGAMLIYTQGKVLVYAPSELLLQSAKNRPDPIGWLDPAKIELVPEGTAPSGVAEGDKAVLTGILPLLDLKGRTQKGGKRFAITLSVPLAEPWK